MLQVILQSMGLVFISEMGDKTQLLALVLSTRFRQPKAIMAGILVATLLNHGLASWLGASAANWFDGNTLKIILSLSFFIFAFWILIPDRDEGLKERKNSSAFVTTLIAFFLAEMGDKTQLATVALSARFQSALLVTAGTTLGMLGADGLAVYFGDNILKKISMKWINRFAALLFFIFGLTIWFGS